MLHHRPYRYQQKVSVAASLAALALMSFPSIAAANPIVRRGDAEASGTFIAAALAFEVGVTMLMLRSYRLRLVRLAAACFGVNLISFALFFAFILPSFLQLELPSPLGFVLPELFVVALEGTILFVLTNLAPFRREESRVVGIFPALGAATAGNVSSVVFGVVMLGPFLHLLQR